MHGGEKPKSKRICRKTEGTIYWHDLGNNLYYQGQGTQHCIRQKKIKNIDFYMSNYYQKKRCQEKKTSAC